MKDTDIWIIKCNLMTLHTHTHTHILYFILTKDIFFPLLFRQRKRERGRERKMHQCEREALISCLLYVP